MFDFFRRKSPGEPTSDALRPWVAMERSTVSLVRDFAKLGTLDMFAGATFALHQDALQAYSVDLRGNIFPVIALDKAKPHHLGSFPERFELLLKALHDIDNHNLDYISSEKPEGCTDDEHRANLLIARMKSEASRVWLLTIMSKTEGFSELRLGAKIVWTILQTVRVEDLTERAKDFTGFYFNDVRTASPALDHWPKSLDFLDVKF
ncbi:hypothetical protein [Bradyrhizobium vignae]|uniref:hypothetical protein n=1 Tax=Bradyrhizobium vignae TaxID=1549949 RepID=UPI00100BD805|nr:hypothetical protein [Bradyrhizobium vignae]RXG96051.1 hypothetical protein EAV90_23610 [Bradyrhizobium vignae]